jgi:hypothetical protein
LERKKKKKKNTENIQEKGEEKRRLEGGKTESTFKKFEQYKN